MKDLVDPYVQVSFAGLTVSPNKKDARVKDIYLLCAAERQSCAHTVGLNEKQLRYLYFVFILTTPGKRACGETIFTFIE